MANARLQSPRDCLALMSSPTEFAGSSVVRTTSIYPFHRRSPDCALAPITRERLVRLLTSGRTLSQHSVRTGRGLFTFPTSSYHRPRCCGVGLSLMAFVIPDATPGSGGMFPPLVVRAGDLMKGAE